MIVIGVDPGLNVCGYAAVRKDAAGASLVEAGVVRTDKNKALAERLKQIAEDFSELLGRLRPNIVAVEKLYSHYNHPQTAVLMGHARGVILQLAGSYGAAVVDYSATTIKKSLTGNGRASKRQMQLAVQSQLGLAEMPAPADVADATAIALCCADREG